jgi:hypothetical protein
VIGWAKTEWCRFGGGSGWSGGTGDILRFSLPDCQGTVPAARCLASCSTNQLESVVLSLFDSGLSWSAFRRQFEKHIPRT